jgi:hypothetical protein
MDVQGTFVRPSTEIITRATTAETGEDGNDHVLLSWRGALFGGWQATAAACVSAVVLYQYCQYVI